MAKYPLPGTVFYDPNGHVLVVYEVTAQGEVRLFDGHPDNSLSHPTLSARQELGPARFGGGFRRALALPDFDAHGSRRQQGRNPQRPKRQVGSLCRRWFLHFAPRSDFHAGAL